MSTHRNRGPEDIARYAILVTVADDGAIGPHRFVPERRRKLRWRNSDERKGTGYYKVPSLKGVWYRGPLEHSGSIASLEEWFDPARLRSDYLPRGWNPPDTKTRPIPGHAFGLTLPAEDKTALIAFLRTL